MLCMDTSHASRQHADIGHTACQHADTSHAVHGYWPRCTPTHGHRPCCAQTPATLHNGTWPPATLHADTGHAVHGYRPRCTRTPAMLCTDTGHAAHQHTAAIPCHGRGQRRLPPLGKGPRPGAEQGGSHPVTNSQRSALGSGSWAASERLRFAGCWGSVALQTARTRRADASALPRGQKGVPRSGLIGIWPRPVLPGWHRGQENTCAISAVEKTYFLVRCLLSTVYLLAKHPASRGGGSAGAAEPQPQGRLAWGHVAADPDGSGGPWESSPAAPGAAAGGHNAHLQSLGADWTPGTQISAPGSPLAAGWGPASDTDSVCRAGGLAPGSSARLQVCTPDPRGSSPGQHHCTSPALQPVPGVCPWRPPRTGSPSPKGRWEERERGC